MHNRFLFTNYVNTSSKNITGIKACSALKHGTVKVLFIKRTGGMPITLCDVIHTLEMPYNLLSLSYLTATSYFYAEKGETLNILNPKGHKIRSGKCTAHLYHLVIEPHDIHNIVEMHHTFAAHTKKTWFEWHCTLSHIN